MARSQRLMRLVQALRRHRRPVTAADLAQEVEVSLRTVYRDIATLAAEGVPVRGEVGIGYVLDAGFDLPPMMFSGDEVEAILVGMRWLRERADPSLARAADDVVAKIGAVLPEPLKDVLFEASLWAPAMGREIVADALDVAPVRDAIRRRMKVEILYADDNGLETRRVIWPFGVAYFERVRVVAAWCELRQGFRHFRTDRLRAIMVLEQRYPARRADLQKRWEAERDKVPQPVTGQTSGAGKGRSAVTRTRAPSSRAAPDATSRKASG